ncbi:MAG: FKBP-type peptidyl-prolyl cis-trans isomerase [Bacteroidota bacterium]
MNFNKIIFSIVLLVSVLAWGCNEGGGGTATVSSLANNNDSVSYAIGMSVGKNLKDQGTTDPNVTAMAQGIKDAIAEGDMLLQEQDMIAVLTQYQRERQMAMQQEQMEQGRTNQAAADAFLAENANKEGVIVHESGVQYEILKEGTGASPTVEDKIKIHYHGTLLDGTVFDSSVDRGEPITFPLSNLIRAWQVILPLMKEGAKYRIYSPPAMAYGAQAPPNIGPNSALIFDIDLLEVNPEAPEK